MIQSPSSAPRLLAAGLTLGLAADLLLFRAPAVGVNATLFLLFLAGWAVYLTRRWIPEAPTSFWLWIAILHFGGMWMIRDNETLLAWDLLATIGLLTLPVVWAGGQRLRSSGFLATGFAAGRVGLGAAVGAARPVAGVFSSPAVTGSTTRRHLQLGIRSVLLSVPLLVLFGALFAAADPIFGATATALISIDPVPFVRHSTFIGWVAWWTTGYLRTITSKTTPAPEIRPVERGVGAVPAQAALGTVLFLFTAFLAIQAQSLFRGEAFVRAQTGLTFAEYARSGFFQLVTAALLALPIGYVAPWLTGPLTPARARSLRAMQLVLYSMVGLVGASALWRMQVYVSAYGLTEDRLYATAIILWIGAAAGSAIRTLHTGHPERTAHRVVVAAAAILALLNAVNPSAVITRYNLAHPGAVPVDDHYLSQLDADAVPVLVGYVATLEGERRCALMHELQRRWTSEVGDDWRSWNAARHRARRLVAGLPSAVPTCEDSPRGTQ